MRVEIPWKQLRVLASVTTGIDAGEDTRNTVPSSAAPKVISLVHTTLGGVALVLTEPTLASSSTALGVISVATIITPILTVLASTILLHLPLKLNLVWWPQPQPAPLAYQQLLQLPLHSSMVSDSAVDNTASEAVTPVSACASTSTLSTSDGVSTVAKLFQAQSEAQAQVAAVQQLPALCPYTGEGKDAMDDSFDRWVEIL